MALQAALRSANSRTPSLRTVRTKTITTKRLAAARIARNKTTMRVVGSRSSAEDPDALAARLTRPLRELGVREPHGRRPVRKE